MISHYQQNSSGLIRYKYVNKNIIQIIVFVPIMFSFIIWLCYLSVGTKLIGYFYIMLAYILMFLVFSFYSAFRQMNRQNRTISEIDFSDDNISFKTEKVLWQKSKEYRLNNSDINVKNKSFDWYGKKIEKEGLSIIANDKELFLVKEYFDDYAEIIKKINTKQ